MSPFLSVFTQPAREKPFPSRFSRKSQIGTKEKVNRVFPHRMVELLESNLNKSSEPPANKADSTDIRGEPTGNRRSETLKPTAGNLLNFIG